MNNLVLVDFEQTCRACMMNFDGENLQSLFDYIDGNDTRSHRTICEVLNSTVQNLPKIEIMDSLPKNLCTNCVEKLCAFDKFQNSCVQSDRKLRELVVAKLTQITDDSAADPLTHSELQIDQLIKDEMIKEEIENFQGETIQQEGDDSINKASDSVEEEQDEQVENQFTCDVCNEKFLYKRNLMKHVNRTHGKVKLKKNSKKVKRKGRKVDSDSEDEAAIEKREFSCDEAKKSNKSKPNIEVVLENESVSIEDNAGRATEIEVLDVHSNEIVNSVDSNDEEANVKTKYEIERDYSQNETPNDDKSDIERVYICEICETEFTYKKNLKRHMQRVHEYEWPQHIVLENEASDSKILKKAKKVNRTWTCEICKTDFLYKKNLHRHMKRTHNEESPIEIKTGIDNGIDKLVKFERKSGSESSEEEWNIPKISIWTCEICQKKFTYKKNLKRHLTNIHNEELLPNEGLTTKTEKVKAAEALTNAGSASGTSIPLYKCNECEKAFHKKVYLRKHKYRHRRPGGLKKDKRNCDACGKEFKTVQNLREHFSSAHPERLEVANQTVETLLKLYICQFCNKNFQQSSTLKDHLRIHTKEQPFLCPHCGKAFNSSSNLRQHMLRHETERKYECPDCPKKFACLSDLASHKHMHKNLKPHICDICSAAFCKPYQLKIHKMYHNGEKRYQCEYCAMRFVCGDHLRRHIRTHTGEKPYKCKYCPRSFSQSNDLIKHLRTHLGENVYQCELCPLAFRLAAELRKHFALHKNDDEETKKRNKIAWQEAQEQLKMKLKSNIPLVSRKVQEGAPQTESNLLVESKGFLCT